MKTSPDIHIPDSIAKPVAQMENCVRKNPGSTLLVAAGIGLAAMLLARAMQPAPARSRTVHLLEDIQDRLSHLLEQGSQALSQGAESVGEVNVDRKVDKLSRSFRKLFS